MSVKPELAFDVCWEVRRGAREVLETKRGVLRADWHGPTFVLASTSGPSRFAVAAARSCCRAACSPRRYFSEAA
jgi:hypothetical protein